MPTNRSKLDLSKFNFSEEQIRAINELVFEELLATPELNALHSIWTGIEYKREIGFITGHGLVGKKKQGCNPTAHDWNINTRKVVWDPVQWQVIITECADKLDNTAAFYSKHHGVRMDDLTDTDYMEIVKKVLIEAIKEAIFRFIWFNDKDAENANSSGLITEGLDLDYFNLLDGFFKQLQTAVTEDSTRLVTIEANAKTTKEEQLAAMTPEAAYNLLNAMYYKLPITVRANGDSRTKGEVRFMLTQTIVDAYEQYLMGKDLQITYDNLIEGVKSFKFHGVTVIPVPKWDEMIQAYNDLGDTYYKPHRALLIERENLAVGLPTTEAFEDVDIFFDKTTKLNHIETADQLDAKLLNFERFVYAQ